MNLIKKMKANKKWIAAGLIIAGALCPFVGVPTAIVSAVGAAVSVVIDEPSK